eukprot:scaffold1025_cov102-Cylindrotheca_fusiformis.AAC.4
MSGSHNLSANRPVWRLTHYNNSANRFCGFEERDMTNSGTGMYFCGPQKVQKPRDGWERTGIFFPLGRYIATSFTTISLLEYFDSDSLERYMAGSHYRSANRFVERDPTHCNNSADRLCGFEVQDMTNSPSSKTFFGIRGVLLSFTAASSCLVLAIGNTRGLMLELNKAYGQATSIGSAQNEKRLEKKQVFLLLLLIRIE